MSRKRSGLSALFLIVGACIIPGWLMWKTVRQEQLDSALIAAIQRNDTAGALAALHSHADPTCRAHNSVPPTFWHYLLARWRHVSVSNSTSPRNVPTALTLAVERDNEAIVEALIAAGARDIGEKVEVGNGFDTEEQPGTLLMFATDNCDLAIMRALVRSGSDVNAVGENKFTALFYCKDAVTIQALADCGANLNAKDTNGWTALDNFIRDDDGSSPRVYALIERGARDAKAMSVAAEFDGAVPLKAMLKAGWNPDTPDEDGMTPLMTALYSGARLNTDVALMLIEHGANVNCHDKYGTTPLHLAADGGRYPPMDDLSPAVVKALLHKGAQINARDKWGTTPLMIAADHLRPVLVRLLLQHGAKVNLRVKAEEDIYSPVGSTALSLAQTPCVNIDNHREDQVAVVRMLKAAGARK